MESVNRGRSGHLLEAAMHMLETVVQVGTERTRTGSVTHNFEYVALYYGMPAAAVLAAHLSGSAPPQDMPSTVSRARLIRELSVFLAYVDSTFREDNVNFAAVKQASIAMSRTLNAALEPTKSPEGEFSSTPRLGWEHNATTQMNPSDNLSSVLSSEDTQLTTTGFPSSLPMDDFVLDEWIQNIDWTATGSDWGYF